VRIRVSRSREGCGRRPQHRLARRAQRHLDASGGRSAAVAERGCRRMLLRRVGWPDRVHGVGRSRRQLPLRPRRGMGRRRGRHLRAG
jgi:hypothetical protein